MRLFPVAGNTPSDSYRGSKVNIWHLSILMLSKRNRLNFPPFMARKNVNKVQESLP